jgi:molecular chaperone DnaK
MTPLIPRNTTIPVKKSEIFSTAADAQTSVEVHVLQGERQMAKDNKSLGMFHLDGIPAAPRGMPQIEVTFDIDANGILSVTAQDKATGKQQAISITGTSTLSKQDVERMVQDAERNAAADHQRRELIDAKNMADSLIYQTEKQLREFGDRVPTTDKSRAENLVKDLREAMNREDSDRIKTLSNELQQAMMQVGSAIYAHAGSRPTSGGDDVIDAEVVNHS